MKKVGIIDIGSNSITLVIYEIEKMKRYKIIDELKKAARLGDMDEYGNLKEERILVAIKTLKMFLDLCRSYGVDEIRATATEAVRRAKNKEFFLDVIMCETGLMIQVLKGTEEAFYDYFGVINTMDFKDGLLMDIGGASTEFVLIKNRQIEESISIPIGAINLTNEFLIDYKLTKDKQEKLEKHVQRYLEEIPWLKDLKVDTLIGVGGTIRNISKIHRKRNNYSLNISHNYTMKNSDVIEVLDYVKEKSVSQRKRIKGLSEARADIFPAAVGAICTVLEYCKLDKIIISGKGLRDGLIHEYICNGRIPFHNVLDFSLQNMMNNYNLNKKHSFKVYELTKRMFDSLENLHGLDNTYDNIIKTACLLHDCGVNINFYAAYKHTFYTLLNSGINGLSHKELILSAILAASSGRSNVKINLTTYNKNINKKDIDKITKIALFLKIAQSFDRSGSGIISDVKCIEEETLVTIFVKTAYNGELEINDAMSYSKEFYKIYEKSLLITKLEEG
ncbi:Ppx/GppA phosphatase family protein [Clostridium sp. DL1XJH146]